MVGVLFIPSLKPLVVTSVFEWFLTQCQDAITSEGWATGNWATGQLAPLLEKSSS
jgi:hypothetical protein